MAQITSYTELADPADDDVLPIVDISDTSMAPTGTTKKVTVADLLAGETAIIQWTGTMWPARGTTPAVIWLGPAPGPPVGGAGGATGRDTWIQTAS